MTPRTTDRSPLRAPGREGTPKATPSAVRTVRDCSRVSRTSLSCWVTAARSIHRRRSSSASLDCTSLRRAVPHRERTPRTISQWINHPPHTGTSNKKPQREELEPDDEKHGAFLMVRHDVTTARLSTHRACHGSARLPRRRTGAQEPLGAAPRVASHPSRNPARRSPVTT
jgi:hypothetical protein